MSMKNPVTPAGIEPATLRFVAQHLNHCATAVPRQRSCTKSKSKNNGHVKKRQDPSILHDLCRWKILKCLTGKDCIISIFREGFWEDTDGALMPTGKTHKSHKRGGVNTYEQLIGLQPERYTAFITCSRGKKKIYIYIYL